MENQNSVCFVAKINEIKSIEGADNIELALIGGWNCIVKKGEYKVGDLVGCATTDAVIPQGLSDAMNVTNYLRKGQRVRTVKLRGVYSECLIIPDRFLPVGYNFEGKDLMESLGIFKFEPPVKQIQLASGKKIRYSENINFHIYHKFPNLKNVPNMFNNEDDVQITRKVHGCLQAKTLITMFDGSKKKIKEIKVGDFVLGYDNQKKEFVKTKVLNTFVNGKTKDWLKITTKNTGSRGNFTKNVTCTPNHQFYVNNKFNWINAEDLKIGDELVTYIKGLNLTDIQKSVLTGKVLGDGSIRKPKSGNFAVEFGHSEKQLDYLKYCYDVLGYLSNQEIKEYKSGYDSIMYRMTTRFDISITKLFENWFIDGKKEIPENISLDPISIAFWYMDDGSLSHTDFQVDRANFATNGFSENSIKILLREFKKFDIEGVKYFSKGWRIRLNKDSAEKLFLLIREYIPESMQYKLPTYHRGFFKKLEPQINNLESSIFFEVKEKIINVSKCKPKYMDTKKYDFETETHNYFANTILVHNSNSRYSIVKKQKLSFLDKLKKFFRLADEWIEYEYAYGSHNVEKGSDSQGFY